MKKGLKIGLYVLAGIVACLLIVVMLIPVIARNYVNEHGEELTGYKLYVEDIDLNLMTLQLGVDSLVVYQPESEEVWVTVDRLDVDLSWTPLFDNTVDAEVALRLLEGGQLKAHVNYGWESQDFDVKFALDQFNMHIIYPFVAQVMTATDLQGCVGAEMHVTGNVDHILALQAVGETHGSGLLLTDKSGEYCAKVDSVMVETTEVNLIQNRYGFGEIYLQNAALHVEMGKDSLDNFTRMMMDAPIDQQPEEAADSTLTAENDSTEQIGEGPFELYINRLVVENAKVNYDDYTLPYDPFVYELDKICVESDSFRLSGVNDMTVSCLAGSDAGPVEVRYVGCFEDIRNMAVNIKVDRLALKDFSPYVVQMFGNPMTGGWLSFDNETKIAQGALDSYNHLIIKDPVAESKRKDVEPEIPAVPLKAGLYILTDKNGVCDMELPVTGNIDEPKFSLRRLIFRTLGKLIVKVAATPINAVAPSNTNNTAPAEAPAEPAAAPTQE